MSKRFSSVEEIAARKATKLISELMSSHSECDADTDHPIVSSRTAFTMPCRFSWGAFNNLPLATLKGALVGDREIVSAKQGCLEGRDNNGQPIHLGYYDMFSIKQKARRILDNPNGTSRTTFALMAALLGHRYELVVVTEAQTMTSPRGMGYTRVNIDSCAVSARLKTLAAQCG